MLGASLSTGWALYLAMKPLFHFTYKPDGIMGLIAREAYPKQQDYYFFAWFILLAASVPALFLTLRSLASARSGYSNRREILLFSPFLAAFPVLAIAHGAASALALPAVACVLIYFWPTGKATDEVGSRLQEYWKYLVSDHATAGVLLLGAAWSLAVCLALSPELKTALLYAAFLLLPVFLFGIGYLEFRRGRFNRLLASIIPLYILPPLVLVGNGRVVLLLPFALSLILFLALKKSDPMPGHWAGRPATAYALAFLFLFSLSFIMNYSPHGPFDLFHEGEALGPAHAYLNGRIPYKDVLIVHGLMEDGFADYLLMEAFGPEYRVFALRKAVVDSLYIPVVFLLLGVLSENLLLPFLLALWAPAVLSFANGRVAWGLLVLVLLVLWTHRPRPVLMALAGFVSSFALFWSLEVGLYSFATLGLTLALGGLQSIRRKLGLESYPHWRTLGAAAAGAATGALPFAGFLAWKGALGEFLKFSFVVLPRHIDSIWGRPLMDAVGKARETAGLNGWIGLVGGDWGIHFVLPAVLFIGVSCAVVAWMTGRWTARHTRFLVVLVFSLFLYRSVLGRGHFVFAGLPISIAALAAFEAARRGNRRIAVPVALCGFLAIFSGGMAWVGSYPLRVHGYEVHITRPDLVPLTIPMATGARTTPEQKAELEWLWKARQGVREAFPFWDFTNQPALYFFADAMNPTRFFQVPLASIPDYQDEVIRDIGRHQVPFILFNAVSPTVAFDGVHNFDRAPRLKDHFTEHYPNQVLQQGLVIDSR